MIRGMALPFTELGKTEGKAGLGREVQEFRFAYLEFEFLFYF